MRNSELLKLIKISYEHVAMRGNKDAARIYVAVVELDGHVRMWKKRALDLGWTDERPAPVDEKPTDPAPVDEQPTGQ